MKKLAGTKNSSWSQTGPILWSNPILISCLNLSHCTQCCHLLNLVVIM